MHKRGDADRLARKVLKRAREIISKPERWTKRAFARDAEGANLKNRYGPKVSMAGDRIANHRDAVCWCPDGAIRRALAEIVPGSADRRDLGAGEARGVGRAQEGGSEGGTRERRQLPPHHVVVERRGRHDARVGSRSVRHRHRGAVAQRHENDLTRGGRGFPPPVAFPGCSPGTADPPSATGDTMQTTSRTIRAEKGWTDSSGHRVAKVYCGEDRIGLIYGDFAATPRSTGRRPLSDSRSIRSCTR